MLASKQRGARILWDRGRGLDSDGDSRAREVRRRIRGWACSHTEPAEACDSSMQRLFR